MVQLHSHQDSLSSLGGLRFWHPGGLVVVGFEVVVLVVVAVLVGVGGEGVEVVGEGVVVGGEDVVLVVVVGGEGGVLGEGVVVVG